MPVDAADREQRRGTLAAVGAYGLWGVFPLYFPLMLPAGSVEILAHRVLWSLAVCVVVLTVLRRWRPVGTALRSRAVRLLPPAAVFLAVNWLVYVHAVNSGQVVETALGYYVNPLVTVLFGVVLLRERLRRAQWAALGTGVVAVLVMTVEHGRPPWIALVLAFSFGTYGLLKNRVGQGPHGLDALTGLTVETAVLAPAAAVVVAVLAVRGGGTFTTEGAPHALLLVSCGVVTVVPLLLFAAGARRVPLSTIGLLQYLTPTLQLLIGTVVQGERMTPGRWVGFGLVWVALAVLSVDLVRHGRRRARAAKAPVAA